MQQVIELNIDGLVGPTHHYAGLSAGNIASETNAFQVGNPQAAALQGLKKMRFLHERGFKQAVFPPHQRPNLELLYQLGFTGTPSQQIQQAMKHPTLLSACFSASSMWAANAATVSASADCSDSRVHFTAANLISNLHRHQEADFSQYLLKRLFDNEQHFQHHPILPRSLVTGDEGAANHSRLCSQHSNVGINLFVYGKRALNYGETMPVPLKYPARQTYEASNVIARTHQLNLEKVVFACQNPDAIDQGVFHNDVIAVANESLLLVHEYAFYQQPRVIAELQEKADFAIRVIQINNQDLSIGNAVSSYLFNSQLLSCPDGSMMLISPTECESNLAVQAFITQLLMDNTNPITQVHYLDLKQSMRNGGGPACLRLRVPLNEIELQSMHQGILLSDKLLDNLELWVKKHYRTELTNKDLADPSLINESLTALDELTRLLKLSALYPFQRA